MNKILFTSYRAIAASGELTGNADQGIVEKCILYAQENEVLPVIGKTLYNKLRDDIAGNTLTQAYKDLLDVQIFPVLLAATLAKAAFRLTFRLTPTGIKSNRAEGNETASYNDVQKVSDEYTADAKKAAIDLVDFLRANREAYPEYQYTGCGCDDNDNGYDVGILLERVWR